MFRVPSFKDPDRTQRAQISAQSGRSVWFRSAQAATVNLHDLNYRVQRIESERCKCSKKADAPCYDDSEAAVNLI